MGMDQYLLIQFLMGWTSIYQLFWGSLGTRVLTHSHMMNLVKEEEHARASRDHLRVISFSNWTIQLPLNTIRTDKEVSSDQHQSKPCCLLQWILPFIRFIWVESDEYPNSQATHRMVHPSIANGSSMFIVSPWFTLPGDLHWRDVPCQRPNLVWLAWKS